MFLLRVLLINRPELLVVENGMIKEVHGGERVPTLWPENGYVGRTPNGAYTSNGPIETWPTREQAQQTWIDVGADEKFARDAVSYSWARNEGQGKAVVYRGFFNRDYGLFDLDAGGDPRDGYGMVGRIPASR